jgi:hypothetical protein
MKDSDHTGLRESEEIGADTMGVENWMDDGQSRMAGVENYL